MYSSGPLPRLAVAKPPGANHPWRKMPVCGIILYNRVLFIKLFWMRSDRQTQLCILHVVSIRGEKRVGCTIFFLHKTTTSRTPQLDHYYHGHNNDILTRVGVSCSCKKQTRNNKTKSKSKRRPLSATHPHGQHRCRVLPRWQQQQQQ